MRCGLFILVLFTRNVYAKECSQLEGYAAETVADYLDSWQNVHLAFQQFAHCDSGGVAEGFSDEFVHPDCYTLVEPE